MNAVAFQDRCCGQWLLLSSLNFRIQVRDAPRHIRVCHVFVFVSCKSHSSPFSIAHVCMDCRAFRDRASFHGTSAVSTGGHASNAASGGGSPFPVEHGGYSHRYPQPELVPARRQANVHARLLQVRDVHDTMVEKNSCLAATRFYPCIIVPKAGHSSSKFLRRKCVGGEGIINFIVVDNRVTLTHVVKGSIGKLFIRVERTYENDYACILRI